MATSRDAPNPLRPYYIPPSIGPPPEAPANHTAPAPTTSYSPRTQKPSFGTQARDILSDLDYDSYFADSSPGVAEHAKKIMDQALWNYTSVLLAQPFEVAKTILQVHQASSQAPGPLLVNTPGLGEEARSRPSSFASGKYEDVRTSASPPPEAGTRTDSMQYPSDSDDDASYFTSSAPKVTDPFSPTSPTASRSPRRRHAPSRSNSSTPTQAPPLAPRNLELRKPDALLEVIAQLWQKEAAWGVWKGTNITFVYNFLLKTSESWTRSLLAALFNIPDPGLLGSAGSGIGGLDIIDSPNPIMSLIVAVAASAIAGLALAPLDLIRTRLIVTSTSTTPRTIYPSLAMLPIFTVTPSLLPVTLLHSTIPTIVSSSTPLFLRSTFAIDPVITPGLYSVSTFLSSTVELFLRLPLETVLRRGQVATLQEHENQRLADTYRGQPSHVRTPSTMSAPGQSTPDESDPTNTRFFKTIVEPGPYKGVFGTMWFIVRDEGVQLIGPGAAVANTVAKAKTPALSARTRVRKGQGIQGLWRGWRVGFWGLVGVWGAAAMGGGGGEF
ncbi:mitochondrial carrier [Amniculicola lignicola CBS 123094]|uniref:Mitochondrial carrier n=1 Tax=Amniculicola lignicola CBS 123094 TaxID=1392246 RepID=A0A6A5W6P7_9PLEO|nr:mitochondrial carrier [Amniculicola lignicola CBS 123094]